MSPAQFFDEFSPLLSRFTGKKSRKRSTDRDRADALVDVLGADTMIVHGRYYPGIEDWHEPPSEVPLKELDPRWLDAAVNAGAVELVCQLARPGHDAANRFLVERFSQTKDLFDGMHVLRTMIRVGHPQAADHALATLKKQARESSHYGLAYWLGPMIAELPKSEAPKFEEALVGLPEKMVDQLMESVLALKNKPE